MKDESHFEELSRQWNLGSITKYDIIQDNVYRLTLNKGQQFVLKQLSNDISTIQRLKFEYDVLSHVEKTGLPVALPILSIQGTPYVIRENELFRLSRWLPNQPSQIQSDEERSLLYRNYGRAIARFHHALSSYEDENLSSRTWKTDFHTRVFDEALPIILKHLNQNQLPTFKTLLSEVESSMVTAYASLPTQLVIWDCHPGNVAVDGIEVSGFLDCDHLSIAPRIFDLADFLVHLIKWDIDDAQKRVLWLHHFSQLIIGYETVSPLTKHEREALYYAMLGIPLIFVDFFFQGEQSELAMTEFRTFAWLVRHRDNVMAQMM